MNFQYQQQKKTLVHAFENLLDGCGEQTDKNLYQWMHTFEMANHLNETKSWLDCEGDPTTV